MPRKRNLSPIAQRIRQLRERAGLTVTAAAAAAGIGRTSWIGLESGRRDPQWDTLARVAAALGASLGDFDLREKE